MLVARGMLERVDRQQYRSRVTVLAQPSCTIGYAAQSTEFAFSREVTASVVWAAESRGIHLICVDNRYSRAAAIRNAEALIKRGVNLVMEFQTDEKAAPIISSLYEQAGIPVIAIEIPHPGATFFGADNYKAGLMGGRHLGDTAKKLWAGEADEILILEFSAAQLQPDPGVDGRQVFKYVRDLQPTGRCDGFRAAGPDGMGIRQATRAANGFPPHRETGVAAAVVGNGRRTDCAAGCDLIHAAVIAHDARREVESVERSATGEPCASQ